MRRDFYKNIYPKLLPARTLESGGDEERLTDRGEKVLGILEGVRKASMESRVIAGEMVNKPTPERANSFPGLKLYGPTGIS